MKRAALSLLCLALAACGNVAHISKEGEVDIEQGFMSTIAESTMQVKRTKEGAVTVTAAQSNFDGTAVPNNVIGTTGAVQLGRQAVQTNNNNNTASVQKEAINHPVTKTSSSTVKGPNGGSKTTSSSETTVPFP